MKARLLALVTAVGAIGVAVFVYVPREGVTRAEFIDAGLLDDCNLRDMECPVYRDGGHRNLLVRVAVCSEGDGGISVIVPPDFLRYVDDPTTCRRLQGCASCDGGGIVTSMAQGDDVPHACACARTDAGRCLKLLADGSDAGDAPLRSTLEAGRWRGTGCWRRSCFDRSAGDGWPSECPQ